MNSQDIMTRMLTEVKNAKLAAWEDFKRVSKLDDPKISKATIQYIEDIFFDGFGRGTLFTSTYIAKITLEAQLDQLTGKQNLSTPPTSPINQMPDDLDDISRN